MDLPNYLVINREDSPHREILRQQAQSFHFPLSEQDLNILQTLENKFNHESNCSGLAAPQIGLSYRAIIFEVIDTPETRQWRPDLTQGMSKSLWLNPSFTPLTDDMTTDYEGCFSVEDLAGPVPRYTQISYQAFDKEGREILGTAEGFLARVIQHEIDHLNGTLFIDYVPEDQLFSISQYRRMRQEAMAQKDETQ